MLDDPRTLDSRNPLTLDDRLRVGWLNGFFIHQGGVLREHKMLKGYLPRIIHQQVCVDIRGEKKSQALAWTEKRVACATRDSSVATLLCKRVATLLH